MYHMYHLLSALRALEKRLVFRNATLWNFIYDDSAIFPYWYSIQERKEKESRKNS